MDSMQASALLTAAHQSYPAGKHAPAVHVTFWHPAPALHWKSGQLWCHHATLTGPAGILVITLDGERIASSRPGYLIELDDESHDPDARCSRAEAAALLRKAVDEVQSHMLSRVSIYWPVYTEDAGKRYIAGEAHIEVFTDSARLVVRRAVQDHRIGAVLAVARPGLPLQLDEQATQNVIRSESAGRSPAP